MSVLLFAYVCMLTAFKTRCKTWWIKNLNLNLVLALVYVCIASLQACNSSSVILWRMNTVRNELIRVSDALYGHCQTAFRFSLMSCKSMAAFIGPTPWTSLVTSMVTGLKMWYHSDFGPLRRLTTWHYLDFMALRRLKISILGGLGDWQFGIVLVLWGLGDWQRGIALILWHWGDWQCGAAVILW